MNLFDSHYWWFWSIGLVFAAFQTTRGIIFQLQSSRKQKVDQDGEEAAEIAEQEVEGMKIFKVKSFAVGAQSEIQIWWLRVIPDGILYFMATVAGFVSLMLAYCILERESSLDTISVGAAGLFVFFALFGLLGITGQLPHLLQQGKWPR